jgi:steroid 5-alpha reductase family enzyme
MRINTPKTKKTNGVREEKQITILKNNENITLAHSSIVYFTFILFLFSGSRRTQSRIRSRRHEEFQCGATDLS